MYLVGQKVITPDGIVGYVDEVTQFDEVCVKMLSETIDAHTPPYDRVVSEYYEKGGEGLTLCGIQRPLLEDFTRFGVIRRLESLTGGIVWCHFNETSETALWLSACRVNQIGHHVVFEDAHWVKGEHLDDVLDFFDLEWLDDVVVEKGLSHNETPYTCMVQVILPCGNLREWSCYADDAGNIMDIQTDIEVEGSKYPMVVHSISGLKALGIQRAQLVSTYSIEGFDDIK